MLSRLEHPSIVQVSDFGITDDGTAYLVMEYLRGQSLGRRIRTLGEQGERLSLLSALQLCFQIADVLAVAHTQGIVHRDIKPENLMLVADPVAPGGERVKLLDFGI
ncbi:MAG TPA: serine/threonine protein kinase, partial [Nitrospira sp.]|nr:serine/threonine protein kinase [Nitrospira sp.]